MSTDDVPNLTPARSDVVLHALEEQLRTSGESFELVVIGGTALQALGIVDRSTKDVDVVALMKDSTLLPASPLPPELERAAAIVARDFRLPEDWLNAGPTGLLEWGLPAGLLDRVETKVLGPNLTVHFAGRFDQIHFKLYAMVDQGAGKHERDLRSMRPTQSELLDAARWARTHDPSPGFEQELRAALRYLGVEDADLGD